VTSLFFTKRIKIQKYNLCSSQFPAACRTRHQLALAEPQDNVSNHAAGTN